MKKVFEFAVKPDLICLGTSNAPGKRKDRFGVLEPGEVRSFREQFNLNGMSGTIIFPPAWGGRRVRVIVETNDEAKAGKQKPGEPWREAAHRTKKKEDEK
jgi:hypothetical protein